MKKAFTLIELLIVVAIIGILAGVGIPMYNGYLTSAKINCSKENHKTMVNFTNQVLLRCGMESSIVLKDRNGSAVTIEVAASHLVNGMDTWETIL